MSTATCIAEHRSATVRLRRAFAVVYAVCGLLLSCRTTDPAEDIDPEPDYEPLCACPCNTDDGVTLRVTYPDSGNVLHVGDSVGLGICAEPGDSGALGAYVVALLIDNTYYHQITLSRADSGPRRCWRVPDSLLAFDLDAHRVISHQSLLIGSAGHLHLPEVIGFDQVDFFRLELHFPVLRLESHEFDVMVRGRARVRGNR